MRQLHLVIRGRVQGVGFRSFVQWRARQLGLHGRVRNLPDGSVEIHAEGDEPTLRQLLAIARRGPSSASVREVDESWSDTTSGFTRFDSE
jgi:acylphosphatase